MESTGVDRAVLVTLFSKLFRQLKSLRPAALTNSQCPGHVFNSLHNYNYGLSKLISDIS